MRAPLDAACERYVTRNLHNRGSPAFRSAEARSGRISDETSGRLTPGASHIRMIACASCRWLATCYQTSDRALGGRLAKVVGDAWAVPDHERDGRQRLRLSITAQDIAAGQHSAEVL